MNHHILTTGISLLTNFTSAQDPRLHPDEAVKRHRDVERFLLSDPKRAAAEINSLAARTGFLDKKSPLSLGFTLIHT